MLLIRCQQLTINPTTPISSTSKPPIQDEVPAVDDVVDLTSDEVTLEQPADPAATPAVVDQADEDPTTRKKTQPKTPQQGRGETQRQCQRRGHLALN
jgi:hypothetical protein